MKILKIDNIPEIELKEILNEAKILKSLDHPNIIRFNEVFLSKNPLTLNIVMEYAEGGDLKSLIERNKDEKKLFKETQILDWITQLCLGLKHLHDRKILHRDIKAQNIFLTQNGMIKIGDFGFAKCLNFTQEKLQTIIGTPYYFSPELIKNKPYSFKSDIWSLGVLIYHISCLKVPFEGKNMIILGEKIMKGTYPKIFSSYSSHLSEIINSLLQVDFNKRPSVNDILK